MRFNNKNSVNCSDEKGKCKAYRWEGYLSTVNSEMFLSLKAKTIAQ